MLLEPARRARTWDLSTLFTRSRVLAGNTCTSRAAGACIRRRTRRWTREMHYVHQDGQQVFKYAVKKMAEVTERVLAKTGLTGADVDCFISHQANKRIITATADRLKMPREKVIINIEDYGNTTAGTIPLAMKTAVETGRLKKGDTLLIASVGAGFTSGASVLKWAF